MNEVDITGFSEINQERLKYSGDGFWYCEIAVTGRCNFNCEYCNKLSSEINLAEVKEFIRQYSYSLRHIQLTGGEPTLYPFLLELCETIKKYDIKLGLSTNGTAFLSYYKLLKVDMFSISLDDYDEDILIKRGYHNIEEIITNIKELSKLGYVNVGLVIDRKNVERIVKIIDFILSLGVHDIKLSVNTKDDVQPIFDYNYPNYPILNYRVNRFKQGKTMRGMLDSDSFMCRLTESDISIVGVHHYPCLVYAREGGKPIGSMNDNVKMSRLLWSKNHIPKDDSICKKYCMDFKCAFNREKQETI